MSQVSGRSPRLTSQPCPGICPGYGGGFELAGKVGRVASGADQLDHLAPELRCVGRMGLGHRGHLTRKLR